MIVSLTYRFLRGTVVRRRVGNPRRRQSQQQEQTHDQEQNMDTDTHSPSAPPLDLTHIFVMGGTGFDVTMRPYPTAPNAIPETLPPIPSFKADSKQLEETVCGICLDTLDEGDLSSGSSCPHVFHTTCITSWLKKDLARSCPVCRNPFLGDSQENGADEEANSSTSSIEPQRSAITARRLAYPVRYPQLTSTAIQPYIYVHNWRSFREVNQHFRSTAQS